MKAGTKAVVNIAGLRSLATKRRMVLFKKLVANLWPASILGSRKPRNKDPYSVTVRDMLGLNKHQANLLQKRLMVTTLCQLYAIYDQDREKVQQTFGVLAANTQHHALQQFDLIRSAMARDNAFKKRLLRISWWPCANTSHTVPVHLRDQDRSREEIMKGHDSQNSKSESHQRDSLTPSESKTPQKSALNVGYKQAFTETNPITKVSNHKALKTPSPKPVKLPLVKDNHSDSTSKRVGGLVASLRAASNKQKQLAQNQQDLASVPTHGHLSARTTREHRHKHEHQASPRISPFKFNFPKSDHKKSNGKKKDLFTRSAPSIRAGDKSNSQKPRGSASSRADISKGKSKDAKSLANKNVEKIHKTVEKIQKNVEKIRVETKNSGSQKLTTPKKMDPRKADLRNRQKFETSPPHPPYDAHALTISMILAPKYRARYVRLCKERHVMANKTAIETFKSADWMVDSRSKQLQQNANRGNLADIARRVIADAQNRDGNTQWVSFSLNLGGAMINGVDLGVLAETLADAQDKHTNYARVVISPISKKINPSAQNSIELKLRVSHYLFPRNELGPHDAPNLCKVISAPCCSHLVKLDLSHNFLASGVSMVTKLIQQTRTLKWVSFKDNCIDDDAGEALAALIESSTSSLVFLDLSDNMLRNSGKLIANSLKENTTLTKLSLRSNFVGDVTGMRVLQALKKNVTLTTLDLRGNVLLESTIARIQGLLLRRRKVTKVQRDRDSSGQPHVDSTGPKRRSPTSARERLRRNLLKSRIPRLPPMHTLSLRAADTHNVDKTSAKNNQIGDRLSKSAPVEASTGDTQSKEKSASKPKKPKRMMRKALQSSVDRLSRPVRNPTTVRVVELPPTEKEMQVRAEIYAVNAIMKRWQERQMKLLEEKRKQMQQLDDHLEKVGGTKINTVVTV